LGLLLLLAFSGVLDGTCSPEKEAERCEAPAQALTSQAAFQGAPLGSSGVEGRLFSQDWSPRWFVPRFSPTFMRGITIDGPSLTRRAAVLGALGRLRARADWLAPSLGRLRLDFDVATKRFASGADGLGLRSTWGSDLRPVEWGARLESRPGSQAGRETRADSLGLARRTPKLELEHDRRAFTPRDDLGARYFAPTAGVRIDLLKGGPLASSAAFHGGPYFTRTPEASHRAFPGGNAEFAINYAGRASGTLRYDLLLDHATGLSLSSLSFKIVLRPR